MTQYNFSHTTALTGEVQKQKEERKKLIEEVYERRRIIAKRMNTKMRLQAGGEVI